MQTPSPARAPQTSEPATVAASARPEKPVSIPIPGNTKIELVALKPNPQNRATDGALVRLAVARDVVVDGVTVMQAGTLITGTVTSNRAGSHRMNRDGRASVRARELESGKPIYISLAGWNSAVRGQGIGPDLGHALKIGLTVALITVAIIAVLALIGGDN
jgi:hypothetical protein